MSDTVSTVGDLCGKHVGNDTVRIGHGASVIEGVISNLTFSSQYERTVGGVRFPVAVTATIHIEDEFELYNIPMDAPASIVARSRA